MTAVLRLISRLLLGSFILALLAAGSIWMLLHGSLPKYNGTVSVRSLANPVVIERDSLGSVTIRAQDRHEMIWALGLRPCAGAVLRDGSDASTGLAGELAELFGSVALPSDREAPETSHALAGGCGAGAVTGMNSGNCWTSIATA